MLQLSSEETLCHQVSPKSKKLVSVSATSMSVTGTKEGAVKTVEAIEIVGAGKNSKKSKGGENLRSNLARVPCIWYFMTFWKKFVSILALLDSGNKVNTIHPAFAKKLGFPIRPTDVGLQKIDGTTMDTFKIVVTAFSVTNKANQVRFFEEIFLVANVSLEVVFEMFFFTLNDIDINILGRELRWRTYTTKKGFPTIRRVELVDKKEFASAIFDLKSGIFIVHNVSLSSVALLSSSSFDMYPSCRPQIAGLIAKKAPTKVSTKYSNFVDIFFLNFVSKLPKHTKINNYFIK